MELDELRKMKDTVTGAAKDIESSIQSSANEFEKTWSDAVSEAGSAQLEAPPPLESYPVSQASQQALARQAGRHAPVGTRRGRRAAPGACPVRPAGGSAPKIGWV